MHSDRLEELPWVGEDQVVINEKLEGLEEVAKSKDLKKILLFLRNQMVVDHEAAEEERKMLEELR